MRTSKKMFGSQCWSAAKLAHTKKETHRLSTLTLPKLAQLELMSRQRVHPVARFKSSVIVTKNFKCQNWWKLGYSISLFFLLKLCKFMQSASQGQVNYQKVQTWSKSENWILIRSEIETVGGTKIAANFQMNYFKSGHISLVDPSVEMPKLFLVSRARPTSQITLVRPNVLQF